MCKVYDPLAVPLVTHKGLRPPTVYIYRCILPTLFILYTSVIMKMYEWVLLKYSCSRGDWRTGATPFSP